MFNVLNPFTRKLLYNPCSSRRKHSDYERFWCQDDDDLKKMITVNCTVFVASFVGAHDAHVALSVVYAVVHIEKSKIKIICT
jgi:hypothetical protein